MITAKIRGRLAQVGRYVLDYSYVIPGVIMFIILIVTNETVVAAAVTAVGVMITCYVIDWRLGVRSPRLRDRANANERTEHL